jgi:uncharacterized protein YukE
MDEMADIIKVNFEALRTAADALRAKAKLFNEQVEQANRAAKPLNDSWVQSGSSAAAAYGDNWSNLQKGAQKVFEDIDRLGQALAAAQQTQQENETRFAKQFGS